MNLLTDTSCPIAAVSPAETQPRPTVEILPGQEVYELNYRIGDDTASVLQRLANSKRATFLSALVTELSSPVRDAGCLSKCEPEITGISLIISNQYFTTVLYSILRPGPDGSTIPDTYHVLRDSPLPDNGAVIIPILPNGRIVMIREFRIPMGKACLQFIRGGAATDKPDEDLRETVKRECAQEAGIVLGEESELYNLGRVHPLSDLYGQSASVVLLKNFELNISSRTPEGDESIRSVCELSISEIRALVRNEQITDAYTLSAFLKAEVHGTFT